MGKSGKNGNGKKPQMRKKIPRGARASRSRADLVLAQGVGKSVPKPFGSIQLPGNCWDAFHPSHAALPRAVGPYTVVRTSALITSTSKFMIFGTFQENTDTGGRVWTNTCAVGNAAAAIGPPLTGPGQAVGGSSNALYWTVPIPSGGNALSSATMVPSAISVQVMNPNALQTTNGIFGGAVVPMQFAVGGSSKSWDTLGTEFVSYFKPRIMSAGKLALRGVQLDSYPLNMSEISNFTQGDQKVGSSTGTAFTWSGGIASTLSTNSMNPVGWAPLCIYNEDEVSVNYLVSIEWRVRFDLGNPAVASHSHHGVSTDAAWDAGIRRAVNLGHGVMDIVERVANVGAAVMPALRGAGRAVPMLVD